MDNLLLEQKEKWAREKLEAKINGLINLLNTELHLMKVQGDDYLPNGLGIIQGNGLPIDLLCSEICLYNRIKKEND